MEYRLLDKEDDRQLIKSLNSDIICILETWCDRDANIAPFISKFPQYKYYMSDARKKRKFGRKSGGVVVVVRDNIAYSVMIWRIQTELSCYIR